jgi:hypothetical protein
MRYVTPDSRAGNFRLLVFWKARSDYKQTKKSRHPEGRRLFKWASAVKTSGTL